MTIRQLKAGRRLGIRGVARKEHLVSLAFLVPDALRLEWAQYCEEKRLAYSVAFEQMFQRELSRPDAVLSDAEYRAEMAASDARLLEARLAAPWLDAKGHE